MFSSSYLCNAQENYVKLAVGSLKFSQSRYQTCKKLKRFQLWRFNIEYILALSNSYYGHFMNMKIS